MCNNILVVENEEFMMGQILLELSLSYDVYTAGINDCMEVLDRYRPDIIILNIDKEEEQVEHIVNELRIKLNNQKISIIITSKKRDMEIKYLKLSVNDFVLKPYDIYIIKLKIDTQLKLINYLKQIEELSLKDKLTGLPNRRSFDIYLSSLFFNTMRNKEELSVIICDIDKFKNFNDTYGHQVGDKVLKGTGHLLKSILKRRNDFVARWGGEEFVIIIYKKNKEDTFLMAEYIRKAVEKNVLKIGDLELKLTISLGVCSKVIEEDDTIDGLLQIADKALYKAKDTGRNKTCIN